MHRLRCCECDAANASCRQSAVGIAGEGISKQLRFLIRGGRQMALPTFGLPRRRSGTPPSHRLAVDSDRLCGKLIGSLQTSEPRWEAAGFVARLDRQ